MVRYEKALALLQASLPVICQQKTINPMVGFLLRQTLAKEVSNSVISRSVPGKLSLFKLWHFTEFDSVDSVLVRPLYEQFAVL